MRKFAILLNGPVGAGKTTLGRAVAATLGGAFLDGDDYSDPNRPWYGSILTTSRAIVREGFAALEMRPLVVIAYPLGCSNWIFFRRKFGDAGVRPLFVGLTGSFENITAPDRGRIFSNAERARIRTMLTEGYGGRPFNDLTVDTGGQSFGATVQLLADGIHRASGGVLKRVP